MRHLLLVLAACLPAIPQTIPQWPGAARAMHAEGKSLLGSGRPAEAEGLFRAAVSLDPGNAPAWLGLGYSLGKQGDRAAALAAIERAAALDPYLAEAESALTLARQLAGKSCPGESPIILDPWGPEEIRRAAEGSRLCSEKPILIPRRRNAQPLILFTSSTSAGTTSNKSPTMP